MIKHHNPYRILFLFFATIAMFIALSCPVFANSHLNIPYISGSTLNEQMLDIYVPSENENKADKPYPVFIFVHGGAWNMGNNTILHSKREQASEASCTECSKLPEYSETEGQRTHAKKANWYKSIITNEIAKAYTDRGIIVVSVNYRLSEEYKHPEHVKDLAAASNWIASHIGEYGGNPKKMIISAHSAGAHLVALLTTHPLYLGRYNLPLNMFNCVIAIDSAGFNLIKPKTFRMSQNMINNAFGTDKTKLTDASPTLLIEKGRNYSPFFLYVTNEHPEAITQTKHFANVLNNKGAFAQEIIINEKYTHRDMGKAIFNPKSQIHKNIMRIFGK